MPSLTVAENLALSVERHMDVRDHLAPFLGLPAQREIEAHVAWTVQDLIELMSLGAFRDKFVRELSTGSRRIADLAMCIAHDPKVLLLDEPAAGIAQKEAEALGPLLERIQRETGCALMLIEHDMPLITGVSDRMIALELGPPGRDGHARGRHHQPPGGGVVPRHRRGDHQPLEQRAPGRRRGGGPDAGAGADGRSDTGRAGRCRRTDTAPAGTARRRPEGGRMRRVLAAVLIAGGSLLGWTASAVDAASVMDAGWWDRNANALIPALDPPPDGALRVANDPAGTSAIAAVRFQLDAGETGPTLTLRVTGDPVPEGAAFVACPTTSEWSGASGAPLEEAPEFDCEAGTALGLVAGDGTSVAFDISQLTQDALVDVVIAPSPTGESPVTDTYAIDFEAPVGTDVTAAGPAPAAPSGSGGSPSGGGAAAPAPAIGGGSSPSSPSFTPSPSSGGSFSPAGPTVTVPGVETPAAGGTPTAGTPSVTTPVDGEQAAAPLAEPSSSKRWIGLLTAAAIIGIGAYLWRADKARAVLSAGPVLGGLGPFARERTGPAPEVA